MIPVKKSLCFENSLKVVDYFNQERMKFYLTKK